MAMAAAAAAVTAGFIPIAQGGTDASFEGVVPAEKIYVQPATSLHGPYHGGFTGENDEFLLNDAIDAIEKDRAMNGSVVTIVANQGEIIANGTTLDLAQACRLERKLKEVHGAKRVVAWFDSPGGGE
jgi:hypothetical protein